MALTTIGGETFNVEVEGPADAPALMLSNSLGTNLAMWDAQIPALSRRFRVIRYDSRGHGRSVAPDRPYSLAELGRDALAILDSLGVAKTHWIGLSKGGMVGQWLLANAPERIGRAVLANTAAAMGPPDAWNDRIRTVRQHGMEGVTAGVLDRWFTPKFQERDPAAVARIRDMLLTTPPQGYLGCVAAIRDMDMREALRDVEAPVLVIVGRHDPSTPPSAGALIAEAIPGAELVTLEAAHLSNIEDEAAFTRTVVEFLTRRDAPFARRLEPARKAARKTAKAAKKAAKAQKKAAKKAAKKAPKTVAKAHKKAAKGATKKAGKKGMKKAMKKNAKKTAKRGVKTKAAFDRRPVRGRTR